MSGRTEPASLGEVEYILDDAVEAHRGGDLDAAERGYRAILGVAAGHFQALNLLGVVCAQTGRRDEALTLLRRAVALRPSDAEARKNLGLACELSGDLATAATHYARAVALDPRLADAQFGLGFCHEAAGRTDAAIECYRRTVALAPEHARAHNNLGSLLVERETDAAEEMLRRAVALEPDYPEAHNNLGALLLSRGDPAAALPFLEKAVALRPGYADALANLGSALRTLGRTAQGMARLEQAVAADAAAILPRWVLAQALAETGAADAAEAVLRGALAVQPSHADTRLRLAQLAYQRGRFAEAEEMFAALSIAGPRRGAAAYGRVQTRRMGEADRDAVAQMLALAEDATLPASERLALAFALGKAFADLGDAAAAMRHYDAGNAAKRGLLPRFDRAAHAALIDCLIATYPASRLRAGCAGAATSDRPILIVGMMRSGTTLVEQILAAHPQVAAGGELSFWASIGSAGAAPPADPAAAAALTDGYLAELDRISPDAPHVTDKLPHNVYALGLIHLLFPRARILHCRRAAADIGLSLYRTLFVAPHAFTYDQGDIVFVLREYERLAAHWREVLPVDAMMEVSYEALVAAPEPGARAMLGFCGLHWDARCLDHPRNERLIRTASAWQARQPVYRGSVGVAQRYAPYLGELRSLLDDGAATLPGAGPG